MAGNEFNDNNNSITKINRTYSFNEAIESIKSENKQLTNINKTTRWISLRTGKEVVIICNS